MANQAQVKNKPSKAEVVEELWRRGNLYWKCHPVQKIMYDAFYSAAPNSTLVWLLARQSGKSFLLAILALECALRAPNSIVKVMTDTKIHMENIFIPIIDDILRDCPEDLKPHYNKAKYKYTFANGSQIQLAGSNGKDYERLRGQKSNLNLVDEAGFCNDLEDAVTSVLIPTTTHTGGKNILASTPSRDPDHDFINFIERAELKGALTKKTIYDNPLLNKEQVEKIIEEMGGLTAVKFRREYLCEIIRDEESVVFPEFNDDLISKITKEWPRPPFFDTYVGMDLGGKDLSAVVFLYYDYRSDRIIVEDELVVAGKDFKLPTFCQNILDKEKTLWSDIYTGEVKKPYRVSDINYLVTQEMARVTYNQLSFINANKTDNSMAINNLRVLLADGKIVISPKCVNLIRHLKNCKWKKGTKTEFDRSPDDGHYDAVDALKYAIRSINFKKNPYPSGYNLDLRHKDMFGNNVVPQSPNNYIEVYKSIFGLNRGKR